MGRRVQVTPCAVLEPKPSTSFERIALRCVAEVADVRAAIDKSPLASSLRVALVAYDLRQSLHCLE